MGIDELIKAGEGYRLEFKQYSKLINTASSVQSSVQILELMRKNPTITAKTIALELAISIRAVEKQIAALKKSGKIERVGSTKSGYWLIIEEDLI